MKYGTAALLLCFVLLIISPAWAQTPIIYLDPGHGTKNSRAGAPGEAVITLAMAREIGRQLRTFWHVKAVYTHLKIGRDLGAKNPDDDNFIRATMANQSGAFIFVRLHADAALGRSAIYYPQAHHNREIARKSRLAAECVWSQIKTVLPPAIAKGGVLSETRTAIGARNGGLLVGSRYAAIPTITIEMVPMNETGKNWIGQRKNQQVLAEAIIWGIYHYTRTINPRK